MQVINNTLLLEDAVANYVAWVDARIAEPRAAGPVRATELGEIELVRAKLIELVMKTTFPHASASILLRLQRIESAAAGTPAGPALTRRVHLTPLAQADIGDALTWYGQRSKAAADGFMAAVEEILDRAN